MKFLKYLAFFLLGIIILLLIVALFAPKSFHAEGSSIINKPKQEVFNFVKQVKNQEHYGVWFRMDKNIQKNYTGTDGTVGFRYEWKSDVVGNGAQVITKIDEGNRVDMDLFFQESKEPAKSYILTEETAPNQTKVTWVIDGNMPYPMNIMGLFYNMNNDFIQGTKNLKDYLEK